ncbi:tetratricopeptide repeat protein [Croceitalea vernalis]|uniref:Tetratricopeptide repeat protein n=1 Tax=Croceitalea vernalis TaxID=3075599 RepID=A0ABU3BHI1_9FLAO|nr:tetratricopeptide repeat protein [Croceitalea sp. P007]MDT0621612.1 tetratricopeptide repeat protein [Croceitalea sp. P007]
MKKYLVFTLLVFLFSQVLSSQNQEIVDSLKQLLANHPTKDSVRADILSDLHEKLMFAQPLIAKKYAEEELSISKRINYRTGIAKGYMHLADFYVNRNSTDSALFYYDNARNIFKALDYARGVVFVNSSVADIERGSGNFVKAIEMLNQNLVLIKENEKNPIAISKFSGAQYNTLATIYMDKGDYRIAVIEALKALDLFSEIDDEIRKADVLKLLGDLEYGLENYEKSIQYYDAAIETYTKYNDDFYLAYAKSAAGLALRELGELEKAKNYQKQAIELGKKNDAKLSLSQSLNSLGELMVLEKNYILAKSIFKESKEISDNEGFKIPNINSQIGLSKAFINNPKESIKYVTSAINNAKAIGAMSSLQSAYALRSRIYDKNNQDQKAINDLISSQQINDSLFNLKKAQQIEELKTIYETEKKEAEIALQEEEINTLNEKAKVDKLTKGLYAGGMTSALALFGLSVFGYRQRIKKNRIAREKQEEILKKEIEHKQKELTSQTLHLVQKNTFIQELMENLENVKNSPNKFKTEFRRIVMLLKKENASDKDWEVFKTYFAEVHNDFDQKLKTLSADISEKEIRLAAFLRMNLTTKEIAATLNVLPDSILKSKYRLKKKLGLDKETDLNQFLNAL